MNRCLSFLMAADDIFKRKDAASPKSCSPWLWTSPPPKAESGVSSAHLMQLRHLHDLRSWVLHSSSPNWTSRNRYFPVLSLYLKDFFSSLNKKKLELPWFNLQNKHKNSRCLKNISNNLFRHWPRPGLCELGERCTVSERTEGDSTEVRATQMCHQRDNRHCSRQWQSVK